MLEFLLGLVLFLGVHSIRTFAPAWRAAQMARWGESRWKAAIAAVSIAGLALLVLGFGEARLQTSMLWVVPTGARHITMTLVLLGFILVAAAYVPGTRIRMLVRSPMTIGVALWAAGHLLANASLLDVVLFGSFLAWSLLVLIVRRDLAPAAPARGIARDAIAVVVGALAFGVFLHFLHLPLIGVAPLRGM